MTAHSDPDAASLLMRFESLGGAGHGCEFGLLQREMGAEPLGLLRWADLAPELLVAALRARFEGVGEDEHTILFAHDGEDDWWTSDRRWWMASRTFVKTADVPRARMAEVARMRLRFLREKLLADLEAGEKIFVFKALAGTLRPDLLHALHQAVRSYGDNVLLYVAYADAANPAGAVRVAAPGLLVGHVEHFGFSPDDETLPSATPALLAICRQAHRLRESGAARGPAARERAA